MNNSENQSNNERGLRSHPEQLSTPTNQSQQNDARARSCFESRMQDVEAALPDSDKMDELLQNCLAIEARITVDIQLSTGGPGDGFEIVCDAASGEPLHGLHYFVWWGYRREVRLSAEELANVCAAYCLEDARLYLQRK